MSVLITDVKMPTCCDECAFVKTVGLDRWKCELSGCDFNSWDVGWSDGTENKYIRHSSCPLVEVPTPLAPELYEFAKFVAKEVCREDFEDGAGAFAEIVCRKLNKLGIVHKTDDLWCYSAEDGE